MKFLKDFELVVIMLFILLGLLFLIYLLDTLLGLFQYFFNYTN